MGKPVAELIKIEAKSAGITLDDAYDIYHACDEDLSAFLMIVRNPVILKNYIPPYAGDRFS